LPLTSILSPQTGRGGKAPVGFVAGAACRNHSAEHSGETWISWVALSTAILAALAAIAALLSGRHVNKAMMNQIEASDQWNYYQAKGITAAVLDAKMSLGGAPNESDQIGKNPL